MNAQERASRVLALLLQFSVILEKQRRFGVKRKNNITKKDIRFLEYVGSKRYVDISPKEFAKLDEMKERYLS